MGHYFLDSYGYSTIYIQRVTTVCPGSSDQFYIVTYYRIWVTTSWTHGITPVQVMSQRSMNVTSVNTRLPVPHTSEHTLNPNMALRKD